MGGAIHGYENSLARSIMVEIRLYVSNSVDDCRPVIAVKFLANNAHGGGAMNIQYVGMAQVSQAEFIEVSISVY